MLNPPVVELFLQRLSFFYGVAQIEALNSLDRIRGRVRSMFQWFEDDGDGAIGESFRELSHSGKGLGGEGVALVRCVSVADTGITAGKDGAERRGFASGAGADGGLAFIEEDSGDG